MLNQKTGLVVNLEIKLKDVINLLQQTKPERARDIESVCVYSCHIVLSVIGWQVLHWMASLTVGDVALRLMPMLVQSSITLLMQHGLSLTSCHLNTQLHSTQC